MKTKKIEIPLTKMENKRYNFDIRVAKNTSDEEDDFSSDDGCMGEIFNYVSHESSNRNDFKHQYRCFVLVKDYDEHGKSAIMDVDLSPILIQKDEGRHLDLNGFEGLISSLHYKHEVVAFACVFSEDDFEQDDDGFVKVPAIMQALHGLNKNALLVFRKEDDHLELDHVSAGDGQPMFNFVIPDHQPPEILN